MKPEEKRIFWIGLGIRLLVIALAAAFGPQPSEFAFSQWLTGATGPGFPGASAFAYGLPQLLVFGPFALLGFDIAGVLGMQLATAVVSLVCEAATLWLLLTMVPTRDRLSLVLAYWIVPVMPVLAYWLGAQQFVFANLLLVGGLYMLRQDRFRYSALLFAASVAAEPAHVCLIPLLGMYLYGRGRRREQTLPFAVTMIGALAALTIPLIGLPEFREALGSREIVGVFSTSVATSPISRIYLLPIAYLCLLYTVWRIKQLDFGILVGLCTIALTGGLILVPSSIGWAMLAVPFLSIHASTSDRSGMSLYIALSFLIITLQAAPGVPPELSSEFDVAFVSSLLPTLVLTVAAALAVQTARRSILRSPFYQAMRRPIAIGIGGDSGSGKDTLIDGLVGVLGKRSVAHVSGDDYHLWDRNKPMWRARTHLDPRANDLGRFQQNVANLIDRRYIDAQHYDHQSSTLR